MPKVRRWYDALVAAGADVEWIDLPARGITGNSHALMADDNSDAIAHRVLDWMKDRALIACGSPAATPSRTHRLAS